MDTPISPSPPVAAAGAAIPYAGASVSAPKHVVVRSYSPASFLTVVGTYLKRRQLLARGFPADLTGWLFITLTVNRKKMPDPEAAYDACNERLRRFIYALRHKHGFLIRRWCWKLEFHHPDEHGRIYPHFHLLLDSKSTIPEELVRAAWGMGEETGVKLVTSTVTSIESNNLFGYMTKAVVNPPQWLLHRRKARFWQTSSGFYTVNSPAVQANARASGRLLIRKAGGRGKARRPVETIGARLRRWSCMCTVVVPGQTEYDKPKYHSFELREPWKSALRLAAQELERLASQFGTPVGYVSKYKAHLISTAVIGRLFPPKGASLPFLA